MKVDRVMIYINHLAEYSMQKDEINLIKHLKPLKKEYWEKVSNRKQEIKLELEKLERGTSKDVKRISYLKEIEKSITLRAINDLKTNIKNYLFIQQVGRCYYCEGEFFKNRTGVGEPTIDHIADKGKYPDYLYTTKNLVLACKECNGFNKKGTKNVVKQNCVKHNYDTYTSQDFIFVHPYLDIKEDHMKYLEDVNVWITVNQSKKGEESIKMFQLDESYYVTEKYKEGMGSLTSEDENFIDEITSYSE